MSASVALLTESAAVQYDADQGWTPEKVAAEIQDTGFEAQVVDTSGAAAAEKRTPGAKAVQLRIGGMTCGACVASIENALRAQPGILSVSVALLAERAVVEYDENSSWTPASIASEIEDTGFDAAVLEEAEQGAATLSVYGMNTPACAATVESRIRAEPGVLRAEVSLGAQTAHVEFAKAVTGVREIVDAVHEAGYDAILCDQRDATQLSSLMRVNEVAAWRHAFLTSLWFTVPLFVVNMILSRLPGTRAVLQLQLLSGLYVQDVVCLALTVPVQFGIGQRFYRSSWRALRHGSATMDVLVMLSTTASWVFSVFAMVFNLFCSPGACRKPTTFFDTSGMLITFVSLGRFLENSAKGRTSEALTRLIRLTPSRATIYTAEGERMIPAELLRVGDVVKVVPGERIAADGTVRFGQSTVDESMVTGEAVPAGKQVGSTVVAGTVNGAGAFDFVVTRAGQDTSLSHIVNLVQEAQVSKAPIHEFADRVAGIFVPSILVLSVVTFLLWFFVSHVLPASAQPPLFRGVGVNRMMECLKLCISVVVVACPCALGLSTPTAMMVGTGVGAAHGILIKGGGPLEAACSVDHVVFDKTGTLTEGNFAVRAVHWLHPEPARALQLIALAEGRSEHVLGRALCRYAEQQRAAETEARVTQFEPFQGAGVRARIAASGAEHEVVLGKAALVSRGAPDASGAEAQAPPLPEAVAAFTRQHEEGGCTLIYASIDGALAGAFALGDTLKRESLRTVQQLQRMNIACSIMTGDSRRTTLAVARELGIPPERVHADLSPNGKLVLLRRLRSEQEAARPSSAMATRMLWRGAQRHSVAMVGDGINDSPALSSADVGIALCSGSDIAVEAASIVLMRTNLLDVPIALLLCQRIFQQIRINFIWATAYNMVMVPLAMGLLLPWGVQLHPIMAGAAMAFSSISVVLSSLTLKQWQRPEEADLGLAHDAHFSGTALLSHAAHGAHALFDAAAHALESLFPHRHPSQGYAVLEMA